MIAKRIFQSIEVIAILAASFVSTGGVLAWSGCPSYITVQWGDTLGNIAAACGTSIEAIIAANPGLGWVYAGQVLYIPTIPTGYSSSAYYPTQMGGSTYVVQWGDTLGNIAVRNGFSLSDILAVNPQIWDVNLIYPGQVINLPASMNTPSSVYNPYTCNPSPYNPSACNYSAYNPSPYNPSTCNPSPYNPTACNPYTHNTYSPSPANPPQFSDLKITSVPGLLVRTGPGRNYSEIRSPFVSAVIDTDWRYRKNSATVDSTGLVWVEVALNPLVNGYSIGWIIVRDTLGNYFTDPKIDP